MSWYKPNIGKIDAWHSPEKWNKFIIYTKYIHIIFSEFQYLQQTWYKHNFVFFVSIYVKKRPISEERIQVNVFAPEKNTFIKLM